MKQIAKSLNSDKKVVVELKEDRYIKIPKEFIKEIHLDNERNMILKSNNNVWFFEIKDKNEEEEIFEQAIVHVDDKWGFTVPLMYYQLDFNPRVKEYVFFNDDNGVGIANLATYTIWVNGKLYNERIDALGFKTQEEIGEYINGVIKRNRSKSNK